MTWFERSGGTKICVISGEFHQNSLYAIADEPSDQAEAIFFDGFKRLTNDRHIITVTGWQTAFCLGLFL